MGLTMCQSHAGLQAAYLLDFQLDFLLNASPKDEEAQAAPFEI